MKPHALPEYLEGRTPKEKHPFLFQKKFHPRQIRNARSVFFGVAGVLASAWGFRGAYGLVSNYHALGARHIVSDFGNRFELGTINTPEENFSVFDQPVGGRHKVPPADFAVQECGI